MSFMVTWKKCKVTDMSLFGEVLAEEGFRLDNRTLEILDVGTGNRVNAKLVPANGDGYYLQTDNDTRYSAFTKKVGQNGGRVMQQYTTRRMENEAYRRGMSCIREEQKDGRILLRIRTA